MVDGLINDCARYTKEGAIEGRWFDVATLKEPYRIEGKKTMGYEVAEQMNWQLPDVIIYPTGGGTGLVGMWKAFAELETLGWLQNVKWPRMVAVQADGCAPVVKAFEAGADFFQTQVSRTSFDDFFGRPVLVFRSAPEASWQGVLKHH